MKIGIEVFIKIGIIALVLAIIGIFVLMYVQAIKPVLDEWEKEEYSNVSY